MSMFRKIDLLPSSGHFFSSSTLPFILPVRVVSVILVLVGRRESAVPGARGENGNICCWKERTLKTLLDSRLHRVQLYVREEAKLKFNNEHHRDYRWGNRETRPSSGHGASSVLSEALYYQNTRSRPISAARVLFCLARFERRLYLYFSLLKYDVNMIESLALCAFRRGISLRCSGICFEYT